MKNRLKTRAIAGCASIRQLRALSPEKESKMKRKRRIHCPICGTLITNNALGKAHIRNCTKEKAQARAMRDLQRK